MGVDLRHDRRAGPRPGGSADPAGAVVAGPGPDRADASDLALAADVTASSFVVRDVKGPLTLAVSAGGVRIAGFASSIDVDLTAGSLAACGVLATGESRLRCSAGSAQLTLERGSSVRMRGAATAGRLVPPHAKQPAAASRGRSSWMEQHAETVIGDGTGRLDVEVTTGNVVLRSET